MSTPACAADAIRLLRNDICGHLEEAEYLALKYEPWSERDRKSIRALIPDLVTIIRGVLALHNSPDECPVCHTAWPCPEFVTIHRLVKDPDGEFVRLIQARLLAPDA